MPRFARQLVSLQRESSGDPDPLDTTPEPAADTVPLSITDHLDRFAIYKMRLEPLETVKQNPKYHPEGDALFHSLQVFHLARDARPYDEEFLLAALLHDVGKAIDPQDHVAAGVEALRGAVTERTLWLIEHHMDLLSGREKPLPARLKRELESSEYFEDLKLLRELDDAGRVPVSMSIRSTKSWRISRGSRMRVTSTNRRCTKIAKVARHPRAATFAIFVQSSRPAPARFIPALPLVGGRIECEVMGCFRIQGKG